MSIAVIYGSTRENGNTEELAEIAIHGLEVEKIILREYNVQPIHDQRHDEKGFSSVADDYDSLIERMMKHDTLIFVTPIYWYSMSGIMKNFIDRWSQTMRDVNFPNFKEHLGRKKAFVIAVGGDNPHLKGLPLVQQFNYTFQFMGISFEGYVLGKASKPGDILNDQLAFVSATEMNIKLKKI
ncbi:MAG: flavodoxin family protein [Paenisporosarcina sp.]